MQITRKNLKRIINLIVVFIVATVGFIKVKHPFSYLLESLLSFRSFIFYVKQCAQIFFWRNISLFKKIIYKEN